MMPATHLSNRQLKAVDLQPQLWHVHTCESKQSLSVLRQPVLGLLTSN